MDDRYPTERVDSLGPYEGQLYVEWGGGSSGKRAWVQRVEAGCSINIGAVV